MKIELKPSHPSEVETAVPLIYSSGPDAFEYVFKNHKVSAVDFLNYAFVRKGGEFSFDNQYSLYKQGEMVGLGSIFDAKKAASFTTTDALNILRFYGFKSVPIMKHGLRVERIIELPKQNEIVLAHLAILPSLRGQGLGTLLIDALMKKVDHSSTNKYVLDVSEENPRAKTLYERLGFVTTRKMESSLKNQFSYVPTHFRMEKT